MTTEIEIEDDYYELLGISSQATIEEIRKSYRRKALKYHPDKNPGNAEAADMFISIAKAYETLQDENMRKEYDSVMSVQHQRARKRQEQNAKQRKMVDDLRDREKRAVLARQMAEKAKQLYNAEIERMKVEARKKRAEEDARIEAEMTLRAREEALRVDRKKAVRLSWKLKKPSPSPANTNVTEDSIMQCMKKFGPIENIVLHGSNAIVYFSNEEAVQLACSGECAIVIPIQDGSVAASISKLHGADGDGEGGGEDGGPVFDVPSFEELEERERHIMSRLKAASKPML